MGFTFNKGFSNEEKQKLLNSLHIIREYNGKSFDVEKNGRTRTIVVTCIECNKDRYVRLVDFLCTSLYMCNSCARKGERNVAKRSDVREKLSRKGVKDTSYATLEWRKKFSERRKGNKNPHYGDKEINETRRKKRIATIKNIEKRKLNGGQLVPAYNIEACKLIDKYAKENGYNFQHAENGGEFYIEELGYWVDGYDKEKNIVIEIDEPAHYDFDGNLKERDLSRQKEIEEFLGCEFIRIKI